MGSGTQFRRTSGLDGLAESNRFLVVYPDGVGVKVGGTEQLRTWNGGYCCGRAVADDVDDVVFLRTLVDEIAARHPVDRARVTAMGHSNGGIMAYRLACEASDVFVAVALQAGSLGVDDCRPSEPVSLVHLHGTDDAAHPIEGGRGNGVAGVAFHPARDGVDSLVTVNGCPAPPEVTTEASVTTTTWSPCERGTAVSFVVVEGGTHPWMGNESARRGTPASMGVDASAALWAFLATHPRRA
jgi:polyhydroxybutyrate depolymerase